MTGKDEGGIMGIGKLPIALFVLLTVVGASIFAVAWQEAPKGTRTYAVVDPDGVLTALLSSTIDEVSYTDASGRTHIYTGWTVQELLVEDLELRIDQTAKANITGLEKGLEAAIGTKLDGISGEHHYNLKASYGGTYFRIKDLDLQGSADAMTTVHMRTQDAEARVQLSMTE